MKDAHSTVRGMEYLIRDVSRYGDLLVALSTSDETPDGSLLRLIGQRISIDGEELERRFEEALKLMRDEARP
jgi:hypothetical protein